MLIQRTLHLNFRTLSKSTWPEKKEINSALKEKNNVEELQVRSLCTDKGFV